ncbi:Imm8 family immunity protein [Cohnella phaseoli]|uniref:Imm8 family immunity protein n=1 Tax=Cohnella phaseoli TaxID=456490 RepID=UPI000E257E5E|nr:Imm8 family immunity protein [Cohnella phaseoli]
MIFIYQEQHVSEDSEGEDNFDFGIITPKALEKELRNEKIVLGMQYFIVDKLDFELIIGKINQILSKQQGETWKQVAESLSPYFRWKYTDSTQLDLDGLLEMIKHSKKTGKTVDEINCITILVYEQ